MKEKEKNLFFDCSDLAETIDIEKRCDIDFLTKLLNQKFPGEKIYVQSVYVNRTGKYVNRPKGFLARLLFTQKISNLPPYCEVKICRLSGKHSESITVWSPLSWNDRFVGCPGGGTSTGGEQYITVPDNTSRGMTLPKAVLNGFTAATTDGGTTKSQWGLDETGKRDSELIENWRARSTHFMTLIGKTVAEILHDRPVLYSYLHGGSGGGRQSMVEAQEYPDDYDGIWTSCPAINWSKFLLIGFWTIAVMNTQKHYLSFDKMNFFLHEAQNTVGNEQSYYRYKGKVSYNPELSIGKRTQKNRIISKQDAAVMKKIWDGPRENDGCLLAFPHRSGVLCWNKIIPIGAFWYPLFSKKPKPFFLSTYYARWITQNPKQVFDSITVDSWIELYNKSLELFGNCLADSPDLTAFKKRNGKLIIDHGIDDPLIPVDNTIDYYQKLTAFFGSKEAVDDFVRLYITPGDGHGTCNWHGPGLTESDGMTALINWVEKGVAPQTIRGVLVNKKGETLSEGSISPQ